MFFVIQALALFELDSSAYATAHRGCLRPLHEWVLEAPTIFGVWLLQGSCTQLSYYFSLSLVSPLDFPHKGNGRRGTVPLILKVKRHIPTSVTSPWQFLHQRNQARKLGTIETFPYLKFYPSPKYSCILILDSETLILTRVHELILQLIQAPDSLRGKKKRIKINEQNIDSMNQSRVTERKSNEFSLSMCISPMKPSYSMIVHCKFYFTFGFWLEKWVVGWCMQLVIERQKKIWTRSQNWWLQLCWWWLKIWCPLQKTRYRTWLKAMDCIPTH